MKTTYDERRDLEATILHDKAVWGDENGLNDVILRVIEDADRLEELEGERLRVELARIAELEAENQRLRELYSLACDELEDKCSDRAEPWDRYFRSLLAPGKDEQ